MIIINKIMIMVVGAIVMDPNHEKANIAIIPIAITPIT